MGKYTSSSHGSTKSKYESFHGEKLDLPPMSHPLLWQKSLVKPLGTRKWENSHPKGKRLLWLPSPNLAWNLKMMVSKRNLLFQGAIFRFHVKLCEGTLPENWQFSPETLGLEDEFPFWGKRPIFLGAMYLLVSGSVKTTSWGSMLNFRGVWGKESIISPYPQYHCSSGKILSNEYGNLVELGFFRPRHPHRNTD